MNLEQMRTKFKDQLAGMAASVEDGDIDTLLNRAYQFAIPEVVSGFLTEGEWTITTVAATGSYTMPVTVYSVRKEAPEIDDTHYLGYYTRPERFWRTYKRVSAANARPTGALFYGQTCELRPIPDAVYTVRVQARVYPSALTSDGLDNETHALAVVYGAAQEYAEDRSLNVTAELAAKYQTKLGQLRTRSNNRPHERRVTRSF